MKNMIAPTEIALWIQDKTKQALKEKDPDKKKVKLEALEKMMLALCEYLETER